MAVCPNCGTESPDTFKFCPACATPLGQAPPPQAEERKVVSVLFVDVVGFTARFHEADPEDVRAVLQPYHQRLKREIEGFGGTVEKFIGDAVMAVFGAPVAHEDDAERAVRAALRITEAIEDFNEEANLGVSIRSAVNTGEGLVNLSSSPQSGEGMVTGDVVNTASRLQLVAPVNGVVAGEITYRSTKHAIVYEEMEPVTVKGKPAPVPVWRAVSARGRFGVDVGTRYRTPFIGRDVDLAMLRTAYQRALHESSLQLVTVVGEPGVGKTRLLVEFAAYVDEQPELVTWRQGRSLPYGEGITFWALGEIVKAQAGIAESDSPDVASDKLATAVGAVVTDEADAAWLQVRLAPLVGATTTGGSVQKEESFTAWLRFLESIATTAPLVLVFEDLHWADKSMVEFVEHLVEWSTGVPVLVIAAARPELFEHKPSWGAGTRNATTITLSPLTVAQTSQLISVLLSHTVLPAEIHTAVLERAGGNPLYAEEFARMLSDRGLLQQSTSALALDPEGAIPMPESVQAVIAARLDTLLPERKSLLHSAAVVGRVFWSGAVASLEGLDEETLRRSLHELARKELIRPVRTSTVEGQQEFSFWHALIRDVAYAQVPRAQRAARHWGVARWLEGIAGERVGDHAEVLAHHYEQARRLVGSGGEGDQADALQEQTIRFALLAGDRAMDLDVARAHRHYGKVLDLVTADHPARRQALLKLGQSEGGSGRVEEGISHLTQARSEFRASGDRRGEARASLSLARVSWHAGLGGEKNRHLRAKAIALLEGEGVKRGVELAWAYNFAAGDAMFAGRPAEALAWAQKAGTLAEEVGDGRIALEARAWQGAARCELGDLGGLGDLDEANDEATRRGWADQLDMVGGWRSFWMWLTESPARGLEAYEQSIERNERFGRISGALHDQAESLWILYDLGKWDELLDVGQETVRRSQERKLRAAEMAALPYMAQVLAWRQQVEEAKGLCETFLPRARHIEDLQTLVPALAIAALISQMQDGWTMGVNLIEELDRATRQSAVWRSHHLPTALRVLIAAGEMEKADNFIKGIEVTATRDFNCVLTGQAILSEARGEMEHAQELYQEAAQRWADYGFVLEEGQGHLGLARCLIALGDREATTEPLQKARVIFFGLGAVPLINETDTHLHQTQAASEPEHFP